MHFIGSIFKKIIFLAIIIAFFYFGGHRFIMDKYTQYTSPPRSELISQVHDFGDLSSINEDYYLTRSLDIMGYKKLNAKYLPSKQKIAIIDVKNNSNINVKSFYSEEDNLKDFISKFNDMPFGLDDFVVKEKFSVQATGKKIPCMLFIGKIKFLPFKTNEGLYCAYESQNIGKRNVNQTTKVILSISDTKHFSKDVCVNFIKSIKFN